jgi:23S rRNA (adenine2503-C2)-methyltransferase
MGCAFCLTATMGLVRNLSAGEIVGQVRVLSSAVALGGKAFNIVLMGMGEPLHNYEQTMAALRILCDNKGFALPPRRITLSTIGLVPAIERLATEPLMPNLAISLHAASEDLRAELVPSARKYSIKAILEACRRFPLKHRDRITFEYVLLAGVNDSDDEARKLAKLLRGMQAKVNLIPLNPAAGIAFVRPSDDRINEFGRILSEHHVTVSVRKSRGRDIRAACGQLAIEGSRKSPAQKLADALKQGKADL